jgi:hypothetical protein
MRNEFLIHCLAYGHKAIKEGKPMGTNWKVDNLEAAEVIESLRIALPGISEDRCSYLRQMMANAATINAQTLMNPNDPAHVCAVGLAITYTSPNNKPHMELLFCDSFCHGFLELGGTANDLLTTDEQVEHIRQQSGLPRKGDSSGKDF